jgi:lipoyl(octanoyl) transferase
MNGARTHDAGNALQAYLVGQIGFEAALGLQRRLAYQVAGERTLGALILCEHSPIITVGRQGSRADIAFEREELILRGWPVRWVNRGGGCVLHLPGQLAIYATLALDRLGLGIAQCMDAMQETLRLTLKDFAVHAQAGMSEGGVVVGRRPIATVGIAVRNWVTYYGAVLNVNPDLEPYRRVSRGRRDQTPMTSMERERRGPVRQSLVRERLLDHFAQQFGFGRVSLFSDHPSLHEKAPVNALATRS